MPQYLIKKLGDSKNCIHHHYQTVTRYRFAVQVDGTGRSEQLPHFQKFCTHHDQIGLRGLAMSLSGSGDNGVKCLALISDFPVPG